MNLESITTFSCSCARASADFWHAVVALRIESACRVDWLGGPRVALARLSCLFGIVVTPRGPDTLHVLSTPYELLGNKVAASAELIMSLHKSAGPILGSNAQCGAVRM